VEIYPRDEEEVSPKKERTRELQLDTEQNAKLYLKLQGPEAGGQKPEAIVTK
jgi:hypothetical protein